MGSSLGTSKKVDRGSSAVYLNLNRAAVIPFLKSSANQEKPDLQPVRRPRRPLRLMSVTSPSPNERGDLKASPPISLPATMRSGKNSMHRLYRGVLFWRGGSGAGSCLAASGNS